MLRYEMFAVLVGLRMLYVSQLCLMVAMESGPCCLWCPEAHKEFKLAVASHRAALTSSILLIATFSICS